MEVIFNGISGGVMPEGDANTSFCVRMEDLSVLIDCSGSPGASLRRAGTTLSDLDLLILTHAHTDHLYAFPSFIHGAWLEGRTKPLQIIANRHTTEQAKRLLDVFGLIDRKGMFPIQWETTGEGRLTPVTAHSDQFVRWFTVEHSTPTIGIRLDFAGHSLVYSCDTAPCSRVREEAAGCNLLIHESNGPHEKASDLNAAGHASAQQAGETAAAAGAGSLALVHLPPTGREQLLKEAQEAFEGKTFAPQIGVSYSVM